MGVLGRTQMSGSVDLKDMGTLEWSELLDAC